MTIDKSRIIEQVVEFLDSDIPQKDISEFLSDELDAIQNTFNKSINYNMLKADKEWFLKASFPCLIKSSNELLIAVSLNKETENNRSSLNLQDGTILRTDCCDLIQEIKLEDSLVESNKKIRKNR